MSVPLDRLYNFLHGLCNHDILIYRFYPHGSKKITDCTLLADVTNDIDLVMHMNMVCHDQEPLNGSMFSKPMQHFYIPGEPFSTLRHITGHYGLYDKVLLLHSEKNSTEVEWFEIDGAVSVYYWSHALIARDWFRYAEVDPLVDTDSGGRYDFLVYNRAWSGTREYRLRFAELVIDQQLDQCSLMNFSTECDEVNYRDHIFKNSQFQITRSDLENIFQKNTAGPASSADYNITDYQQCRIEVVLETLFDDTRLHLTEKVFRPIACKKPFILAATPGSLEYIRSYGFKTFGDYIDESYDLIQDPKQRLNAIVALMKHISSLPTKEKAILYQNLRKICEYNHNRFFSNEFFNDVVTEFQTNLENGVAQMKQHRNGTYLRRMLRAGGRTDRILKRYTREVLVKIWIQLRKWGSR